MDMLTTQKVVTCNDNPIKHIVLLSYCPPFILSSFLLLLLISTFFHHHVTLYFYNISLCIFIVCSIDLHNFIVTSRHLLLLFLGTFHYFFLLFQLFVFYFIFCNKHHKVPKMCFACTTFAADNPSARFYDLWSFEFGICIQL